MDVRSDVEGRPFVGSIYRDPFDGPEPVTIYLVFEVNHLEGPSMLQVRDVVVRVASPLARRRAVAVR